MAATEQQPGGVMSGPLWRLAIISFLGGIGGGVIFPIIPVEGLRLGISAGVIGLILSLNRITRLGANPITGVLVDRLGPRWPLSVGMIIESVSPLCFYAGLHSGRPAVWFMVGRALWGVGSSLLMVGAMTAALLYSDERTRGMASAKIRMGLSFGVPGGLILGGLIADAVSADAAFLTAGGVTLVGTAAAILVLPRRSAESELRPRSATALPESHPEETDARPRRRFGEVRNLLRPGPLWTVWLYNFALFFSVQGVILAALVLVVEERSFSIAGLGAEGTSGMLMAVMITASAVASLFIGRRVDRRQRRTGVLVPSALVLAAGYIVLAISDTTWLAAVSLCAIGAAVGGINIPLMVILGDLIEPDLYGRTVAIHQVLGDVGGSLGPVLGLAAVDRWGSRDTLLASAIVAAASLPLSLLLRRREL